MKALRITSWDDHYETAESRRVKSLLWVATPNGHDSVMFRRLIKHPNGMAHYGAWNLILQTASKCSPRGLLMFGPIGRREPHNAASIADVTGASEKIIEEAIHRLLEIGWLEEVEVDAQQTAGQAQQTAGQAQQTAGQAQRTAGLPTTTGKTGLEGQVQQETARAPEAAVAVDLENPFEGESLAVARALSAETWMEWKNKYLRYLGMDPQRWAGASDWADLFNRHGWAEMCKAADYLIGVRKDPSHKIWPDQFAKLEKRA